MEWRCVKLAKSKRWWYFSTLNMYINRLCFNQRSLHWVWRRHGSICSKQFWLSKQLFVELASCLPLMVSPQNDTMVWSQLCHGSTSIKKQPESKQSALTWAISPCQTTGKINLELTVKVVLTYADEKPARTNKLKTTNDQRDSDHRNSKKNKKKRHPDSAPSKTMKHLSESCQICNVFSISSRFHFRTPFALFSVEELSNIRFQRT